MSFFDRVKEVRLLDEVYNRKGAQFVALYGRRRIGKTALINKWIEDKKAVYWVAHRSSSKILLQSFSQAIAPVLSITDEQFTFSSWKKALDQIAGISRDLRIVIVIDELPYLIEAVPSFSSLLQTTWDNTLSKSNVFLLLCGSHFHMMQSELISPKGALYGRTTADILLEDIAPEELKFFLPRYSPDQIVETFSILGGVPKYLELWDDTKTVFKNIEELILSPVTIFRHEPVFLIQDEIADVRTYLAILEAIGGGMRPQKAIAEKTGIALPNISKYLNVLTNLGFIRRIISVDAPDHNNTRMSSYEIRDSYLRFYFEYLQPNVALLEQKRERLVLEIIKEGFNTFTARNGYEELCRRYLISRGDSGNLSFQPLHVGRIWNRNVEIDIAAIDPKTKSILLGECKWKNTKVDESVLAGLKEKSGKIKNISDYNVKYALFSKSGFTKGLYSLKNKENLILISGPEFSEI